MDPLYKDVKNRIVAALRAGQWRPGEALPSEAKLAEMYDVGISTIRAAVGGLEAVGLVMRRQGKGTYVIEHGDEHSVYRFFNIVRDGGQKELPVSELVSIGKATADDEIADLLRLPRGPSKADVFRLRNVLRIGESPVSVSDITVPASLFPGLNARMIREHGKTIYAVFQQRFGVTVVKIVEELKAVRADALCREYLGVRMGEPVLELRRIGYSFNGQPVEIRRSRIDTRSTHYRFEQGDHV